MGLSQGVRQETLAQSETVRVLRELEYIYGLRTLPTRRSAERSNPET